MKIIKYLFISVFLYYCFTMVSSFYKVGTSVNRSGIHLPRITNQYTDIFSEKTLNSIQPFYTYFINYKNPIATFNTNDGQYSIIVYKFDNVNDKISLPNLIKMKWKEKNTEITTDLVYTGSLKTAGFHFRDAAHKP
jgi:hypothetical protein